MKKSYFAEQALLQIQADSVNTKTDNTQGNGGGLEDKGESSSDGAAGGAGGGDDPNDRNDKNLSDTKDAIIDVEESGEDDNDTDRGRS